jgi:hypothetical protein
MPRLNLTDVEKKMVLDALVHRVNGMRQSAGPEPEVGTDLVTRRLRAALLMDAQAVEELHDKLADAE